MKSDRITILLIFSVFLGMLLTYARLNHMEQKMAWQRIEGLTNQLDSLIVTIRNADARYASYSEELKTMRDRVELMENEKRDLWAKLDNISRDMEGLRTSVIASRSVDTTKKVVELGAITVKKQEKSRR